MNEMVEFAFNCLQVTALKAISSYVPVSVILFFVPDRCNGVFETSTEYGVGVIPKVCVGG